MNEVGYAKMAILAKALRRATDDGTLKWERTSIPGDFLATFPDYSVQIGTVPDELGREELALTIRNSEGNVVEIVGGSDLAPEIKGGSVFLNGLYFAARRIAMGIDVAVDSLLRNLGVPPVGNTREQEQDDNSPPPPDDDLPF